MCLENTPVTKTRMVFFFTPCKLCFLRGASVGYQIVALHKVNENRVGRLEIDAPAF